MSNYYRPSIGLVLLALILCAGRVPVPAGAYNSDTSAAIELKTTTTVDHPVVTISDIIKGELPEGMSDFTLGEAPAPGDNDFYNRARVMMLARQAGEATPEFLGREIRTEVRRPSRKLERQELMEPVKNVLQERISLDGDGEVEIEHLPRSIEILPGDYQLRLDRSNPYHDIHTSNRHTIIVEQEGNVTKTVNVRARVADFAEVVVTSERIKGGEKITEENVELKQKEVRRSRGDVVLDIEEARGLELSRSLTEGTILRGSHLERPSLVERRSTVTIRYKINGLTLSARGTAESDGYRGEKIVVKNDSSGDKVYAEVIGEREVRVVE